MKALKLDSSLAARKQLANEFKYTGDTNDSATMNVWGLLINLIIQIVSGAIGGNVAGAASKDMSLGTAGNTIAGAIGGGVGGQLLGAFIPLLANTASTVDIGALVGQFAGGGVAGAILTAIVGLIKKQDGLEKLELHSTPSALAGSGRRSGCCRLSALSTWSTTYLCVDTTILIELPRGLSVQLPQP